MSVDRYVILVLLVIYEKLECVCWSLYLQLMDLLHRKKYDDITLRGNVTRKQVTTRF